MSSERETLISKLPFVREFVLEAIKISVNYKIQITDKEIIHADLVPKISKEVMHASMGRKTTPPIPRAPLIVKKPIVPRMHPPIPLRPRKHIMPPRQRVQQRLMTPPPRRLFKPKIPQKPRAPPRPIAPHHTPSPQLRMKTPMPLKPLLNATTGHVEGYGKINAFLEDPTISSIECPGPGKPIVIIRVGQRQITKIILGPKEIQEILDTVADQTHIPLLEGVFRAALDTFSISAVISEMIGSKFVIKKHTAYSLLEK